MGHRITMENSAVQGQMCDLLSREVEKKVFESLTARRTLSNKTQKFAFHLSFSFSSWCLRTIALSVTHINLFFFLFSFGRNVKGKAMGAFEEFIIAQNALQGF